MILKFGIRNAELLHSSNLSGNAKPTKVYVHAFQRVVGVQRAKPFGRSPQRAKFPKLTGKYFAAIEKSLTAKKGAIHKKKV